MQSPSLQPTPIEFTKIAIASLSMDNSGAYEIWDEDKKFIIKTAVGIQNYMSSGTLLMKSLMDGHPEILTCPGIMNRDLYTGINLLKRMNSEELHKINFYDYFINICGIPVIGSKNLIDAYGHGLDQLGEDKKYKLGCKPESYRKISLRIISSTYNKNQNLCITHLYLIFILSYKILIEEDSNRNEEKERELKFVWDIHSKPFEDVKEFFLHFSKVKVIHMWRNPVSSIDSSFKHINSIIRFHQDEVKNGKVKYEMGNRSVTQSVLEQMFLDLSWLDYNKSRTPFNLYARFKFPFIENNESKYIWLEDLHLKPKEVLTNLCIWLDINWYDSLLDSTFDGKKYWNRKGSDNFSGFNPEFALKKSNIISENDALVFKYIFNQCLISDKYSIKHYQFLINFFKRLNFEKIEYIQANRLYSIYKKINYNFIDEEKIKLIILEYLFLKRNRIHLIDALNNESFKGRLIRNFNGSLLKVLDPNSSDYQISLEMVPNNYINFKLKLKLTIAYHIMLIIDYLKIRICILKCIVLNKMIKNKNIYPQELV
jgi:hypothetical protein